MEFQVVQFLKIKTLFWSFMYKSNFSLVLFFFTMIFYIFIIFYFWSKLLNVTMSLLFQVHQSASSPEVQTTFNESFSIRLKSLREKEVKSSPIKSRSFHFKISEVDYNYLILNLNITSLEFLFNWNCQQTTSNHLQKVDL